MAVGIRIKGLYGQLQISEDSPVNSILFSGSMGGLVPYTDAGTTLYATGVTFPATITTTEQPLVFLKVTNTVQIFCVRVIGSPGAWTGFAVWGNDGVNTGAGTGPRPVEGTWFITTTQAAKSNARYGIRIRNPVTNAIVFDSGYPIARFLQWTPTFVNGRVISTAYDSFSGSGMYWDVYAADTPVPYASNAHFLANSYTGRVTGGPYKYPSAMTLYFNASNPYNLTVETHCPSGYGPSIFGPNAWNLVWATPGP